MSNYKYIKDHSTQERIYPLTKSECVVDMFTINEAQIDSLFGEIISFDIVKDTVSVPVGTTVSLTVKMESNGSVDKSDIKWTSSDETVATVSAGDVTGISAGQCTITATSDFYDITDSIIIQVNEA